MSKSSFDVQTFLSMTKNESDGNAGKKQKGKSYLHQLHFSSADFFENNLKHKEGWGANRLVQNATLEKMLIERNLKWFDENEAGD